MKGEGEVIKVAIEQEHINEGRRGQPAWCPLALALRDLGDSKAMVALGTAFFRGEFWYLSPPLIAFVQTFDAGLSVVPGDYRMVEARGLVVPMATPLVKQRP